MEEEEAGPVARGLDCTGPIGPRPVDAPGVLSMPPPVVERPAEPPPE